MLRSGTRMVLISAALALAACGGDDEKWLDQASGGAARPAGTSEARDGATPSNPRSKGTTTTASEGGAASTAPGGSPAISKTPDATPDATPGKGSAGGSAGSKGGKSSPSRGSGGATPGATPGPRESRLSKDPRGDEKRASEAIATFFKESNAKNGERVCRELYTQDGVERRTGKSGAEAIAVCIDNVKKYKQPELVKVLKATSNNFEWVTLIVKLKVLSKERDARVILRLRDGIWKVDRIAAV